MSWLISKINCTDEFAEQPDVFVLELTRDVQGKLYEFYQVVKTAMEAAPNLLRSCDFDLPFGEWLELNEQESQLDVLLPEGTTIAIIEDLPEFLKRSEDANNELHIRGHSVTFFEGYCVFSSYEKYSGVTYESENITISVSVNVAGMPC